MRNAIAKAVRRFVGGLAVLMSISVLLFAANEKMGDPTYALLPIDTTEEARQAFRESLGLDGPLIYRLLVYLRLTVTFQFGTSYKMEEPVLTVIGPYVQHTLQLIGLALPLGLALGIMLGIAGLWLPAWAERLSRKSMLALHALPGFVPALLAIELFAVKLKWLPPSGSEGAASLVLPVAMLAGAEALKIGVLLRSKLHEVQSEPYVLTARAKGLGGTPFLLRYLLRPALSLVFSFASIQVGVLLSSVVVIESVFAYPGIGSLAVQAVSNRDFPLLQACVVIASLLFIVSRFVLELLHPLLDPRLAQAEVLQKERSPWS